MDVFEERSGDIFCVFLCEADELLTGDVYENCGYVVIGYLLLHSFGLAWQLLHLIYLGYHPVKDLELGLQKGHHLCVLRGELDLPDILVAPLIIC